MTSTTVTKESHKLKIANDGEIEVTHETGDQDIYIYDDHNAVLLSLLPAEAEELCVALGYLISKVNRETKPNAEGGAL